MRIRDAVTAKYNRVIESQVAQARVEARPMRGVACVLFLAENERDRIVCLVINTSMQLIIANRVGSFLHSIVE